MLRTGITTGACAAAAAQAATLLLYAGDRASRVTVFNPSGLPLEVPVAKLESFPDGSRAVVIKDGGDDPDVTHGLEVVADARAAPDGVTIRGGPGVGVVTRPGLALPVGEPAINPVPRQMITRAAGAVLPPGKGVEITISIPEGEKVADRTLNLRLGITGGISVLGTTGIVRPMSEEGFKNSLVPLVQVAVAAGYHQVVLTPGRFGTRLAVEKYGLPAIVMVEMSNFVGFMLGVCVAAGVTDVLLWGHHGKLLKVAAGIFHTHSRLADARQETLASHAALLGAGPAVVAQILEAATVEEVIPLLEAQHLMAVFTYLARRASRRAAEYVGGQLRVGTVFLGLNGRLLGMDEQARLIGGQLGCHALK